MLKSYSFMYMYSRTSVLFNTVVFIRNAGEYTDSKMLANFSLHGIEHASNILCHIIDMPQSSSRCINHVR